MTQKYRGIVAWGVACGSLLLSIGLWTEIADEARVELRGDSRPPQTWEGVLHSAGRLTEEVTKKLDDEKAHGSAPLAANVVDLPGGGEGVRNFTAPAFHRNQDETDLAEWEVKTAYTVSIPVLGIQAPVLVPSLKYWNRREWNLLEKQMQVGLAYGTVAYPHSVRPGQKGTVFLAGHSSPPNGLAAGSAYGEIFAKIPELKPGNIIALTVGGRTVRYEVRTSEVVSASATEILLQQNDEALLKLITCFPIGTTKDRMIVTAVMVTDEF